MAPIAYWFIDAALIGIFLMIPCYFKTKILAKQTHWSSWALYRLTSIFLCVFIFSVFIFIIIYNIFIYIIYSLLLFIYMHIIIKLHTLHRSSYDIIKYFSNIKSGNIIQTLITSCRVIWLLYNKFCANSYVRNSHPWD